MIDRTSSEAEIEAILARASARMTVLFEEFVGEFSATHDDREIESYRERLESDRLRGLAGIRRQLVRGQLGRLQ